MAVLGATFEVAPSNVDEREIQRGLRNVDPAVIAQQLATAKAHAVAQTHHGDVIIGADSVVSLDGEILGKPLDRQDALRMLRILRGRDHNVTTSIAIVTDDERRHATLPSRVSMRWVEDAKLDAYVATGEPMDKAGAYAVQGLGGRLVAKVEGCYLTVVGFPLCALSTLLSAEGLVHVDDPISLCSQTATSLMSECRASYKVAPHPPL